MKPTDHITRFLEKTKVTTNPEADKAILNELCEALDEKKKHSCPQGQNVWRIIMNSKIAKFAAAAVIICAAIISVVIMEKSVTSVYAIEETIEAFKKIHFVHIIRHDAKGQVEDERWIEIKADGTQGRYWQDTPGNLLVVDNLKNRFIYRRDKNTVLLYAQDGPQYMWIANLHEFFRDMASDGTVTIDENSEYKGKQAHLVRWLKLNIECFIDPESKLPISMQNYELSYGNPPENIFNIPEIPEGVDLIDRRSGDSKTEEPEFITNEEKAQALFEKARKRLGEGKCEEAIKLFRTGLELEKRDNWAWYWSGRAYYCTGEYDLAIEAYTKVIEMFKQFKMTPHYAHLSRGMAYRKKGNEDAAWDDFKIALPVMISALRNIEGAEMFDYADDPLSKGKNKTDPERFTAMILRLKDVAQSDYVYDPMKKKAML